MAMPLTKLTKKKVKFVLSIKCEKSFQDLKDILTSALMLAFWEGLDECMVYNDSSRDRLGCVLIQNRRVITYASKQLKDPEKNYPTHDSELADVLFVLKIGKHYLYGLHVDILNDHKSLICIYVKGVEFSSKEIAGFVKRL